jgi:hypothetical protein
MTQLWNTSSTWWNDLTRAVLVALALCVSACTGPGYSTSVPAAHSPEGGHAEPMPSGNGNGGNGM